MKKKMAWLDRVPGKAARLFRGQESTANEKKMKGMRITVRICTLAEAKSNYVKYYGEVQMLRRDERLVGSVIFETTPQFKNILKGISQEQYWTIV